MLSDRPITAVLEDESVLKTAVISKNSFIMFQAFVDASLSLKEFALGRPDELDDSVKAGDNCCDSCTNNIAMA